MILTAGQLNRAVLARQGLLERARVPVPAMLEQMAGLQAQYAPSMYIGLWSRLADFTRGALTTALNDRTVVQGTLLRVTIHLVSAADYWPMSLAIRESRRKLLMRTSRGGPSEAEWERAAATLEKALADGPMHRTDIDALLGKEYRFISVWLDLVRVPPLGTWERRRADLFGLASDWIGAPTGTAADGVELLVRRYLGGFGPATRTEIANWAGLPVATIAPALAAMELRRFTAEDGADLLDLPDAPLPDAGTDAPVRLLPTWDASLLVHARRAVILPEEYRSRIFNSKIPQSVPTVLVNGQVAGTWRVDGDRIEVDPFHRLPAAVRRQVDAEAEAMLAFHR